MESDARNWLPWVLFGATVLIAAIAVALVAFIAYRIIRDRTVETALESGVRETVKGGVEHYVLAGGTPGPEALEYARDKLRFGFTTLQPEGSAGNVTVVGTVRNTGEKHVTYLMMSVSLGDGTGAELGGATDLAAHGMPIGDNSSPILAGETKKIILHVFGSMPGWKTDHISYTLIEAAVGE